MMDGVPNDQPVAAAGEALRVDDLSVEYSLVGRTIRAVRGVSLSLRRGSALGIVGESGCGKSTLAAAVMRILPNNATMTTGGVWLQGQRLDEFSSDTFRRTVRWKQLSMIFQGSMDSLNPVVTVRSQLRDLCRLHSPREDWEGIPGRISETLDLVGLSADVLTRYPHELSGGMKQRVGIAMALLGNASVVLADEATTALDVLVQERILRALKEAQLARGLSLVVISHDINVIRFMCDDVLVLYAGEMVERGPVAEVLSEPAHPYTRGLLGALPTLRGPRQRIIGIPGSPPDLSSEVTGCSFAPRCALADETCRTSSPPIHSLRQHKSKCHFALSSGLLRGGDLKDGSGPDDPAGEERQQDLPRRAATRQGNTTGG